jgi:glycerophosphoryl diester phosphodiesterase
VIGHRGSRATHPENTIAGFEHAVRVGADAIELDVTPAQDGVLAVTHDPVYTDFGQLPAGTPRIEDVVEYAQSNSIFFDVEAKYYSSAPLGREEYARALMAALAPLAGRVALRSFSHRLLRIAHEIAPEIPKIALTKRWAVRWPEICRRTHSRAISPQYWLVTPGEVRRAQRAGLAVYTWTVNREQDWRRMLRIGVDGIITDDPQSLIRFLDRNPPGVAANHPKPASI